MAIIQSPSIFTLGLDLYSVVSVLYALKETKVCVRMDPCRNKGLDLTMAVTNKNEGGLHGNFVRINDSLNYSGQAILISLID